MENTIYFSPSRGFLESRFHVDIPSDAVPLTHEQRMVLVEEQASSGGEIAVGKDGVVRVVESGTASSQSAEALAVAARIKLIESDRVVLRCYESGASVPQAWVEYREQLRALVRGEAEAIMAGIPPTPAPPS